MYWGSGQDRPCDESARARTIITLYLITQISLFDTAIVMKSFNSKQKKITVDLQFGSDLF